MSNWDICYYLFSGVCDLWSKGIVTFCQGQGQPDAGQPQPEAEEKPSDKKDDVIDAEFEVKE